MVSRSAASASGSATPAPRSSCAKAARWVVPHSSRLARRLGRRATSRKNS
ncbi:Uncharacterised protein [Mycobacteroides abscessus subsp. abscessus]|nr:Uncharacterised protein [Mycobacteroides abscessus subsp. abscessus]